MDLLRHLIAFAAGIVVMAGGAGADERFAPLGQEATVAIMRHALAPGTGDPPEFRLDACATQRNLDDRGRAQARAVGAAIRASGVKIDRVLTSQWCRCRETAELLDLGEVEEFPALNSFFEDRSTADAQTRELRAFLAGLRPGETVMLVTHQVNITALTGRGVGSGEVFLLHVGGGEIRVVDEVMIAP